MEMFQSASVEPAAVWDVVGDPWRLAEWTDVESVADVRGEPAAVGTEIETVEAGTMRLWRITTLENRLLEMTTTTERGRMTFGCRAVRDARGGTRLVLAARLDPDGLGNRLRALLVSGPRLRRQMDQWADNALRVAATSPG